MEAQVKLAGESYSAECSIVTLNHLQDPASTGQHCETAVAFKV
jgi:hypothetical protein